MRWGRQKEKEKRKKKSTHWDSCTDRQLWHTQEIWMERTISALRPSPRLLAGPAPFRRLCKKQLSSFVSDMSDFQILCFFNSLSGKKPFQRSVSASPFLVSIMQQEQDYALYLRNLSNYYFVLYYPNTDCSFVVPRVGRWWLGTAVLQPVCWMVDVCLKC